MIPQVDVTLSGADGQELSAVAERISVALIGAGAHVKYVPGPDCRHQNPTFPRGVSVRVRIASIAPALLPAAWPASRGRGDIWRIVLAGLVLLAVLNAEIRLHFGLRLDVVLLVAAAWGIWRWTGGRRRQ